jgi:Flp pilus assembly protein TadG
MKRQKGSAGSALVEMALVLPVLLAMMFGIAQFAWWLNSYIVLESAAATGARQLATERGFGTPWTDTVNAVDGVTASLKGAKTITLTVGGTTCTSDTTCVTLLGSSTQAPAAGTRAAVSILYTSAPLFTGGIDGLAKLLPTSQTVTTSVLVQ